MPKSARHPIRAGAKAVLTPSAPRAGGDGVIAGMAVIPSGDDFARAAERALAAALDAAGAPRGEVGYVATTGYGRYKVPLRDLAVTELTCRAYRV